MRSLSLYRALITALVASFSLTSVSSSSQQPGKPQSSPATSREDAYRANNLGVALLEQFKFKEGAEQFRRALQLDPRLAVAQTNLAIAYYYVPEIAASLREAKVAATVSPDAPQPYFILGLIAKAENRTDDAIQFFQRVLKIDPRDVASNFYLGQLYSAQRRFTDAVAILRTAVEAEPYNSSAVYGLYTALNRMGEREEGARMGERFKALREGGYGTSFGNNYLEQGRYAEAVSSTGAEPDLVDTGIPDVRFSDQTASSLPAAPSEARPATEQGPIFGRRIAASQLNDDGRKAFASSFGGGVALVDYDSDGDLDLVEATGSSQRLYRNDRGKFVDVTAQSASISSSGGGIATGVIVGDYDNDTKPDIFVLRYGASSLYHNDGGGKFSDATVAAGITAYPFLSVSAAFVDVDHDGDLDIFIAGLVDLAKTAGSSSTAQLVFPTDFAGAPNLLLRNNGNGKFSDITAEAKVTGSRARGVAVVPTDYDNRRDIDLLVVNFNAVPTLFRNMRDGSFSDVGAQVGLTSGAFTSAAAGDVNKDGYTDFYFGAAGATSLLAVTDGKGSYTVQPVQGVTDPQQTECDAAILFDYDNDGIIDLACITAGPSRNGLRLLRNAGKWTDVTGSASETRTAPRVIAAGDIDGDGDTDLVVRDPAGGLRLLRNDGGNRNHCLQVRLEGKVGNRSGAGSKIEMRAGSLKQRVETYAATPAPAPADVVFGLGKRQTVDAVRVLWPSGIVQAETEIPKPKSDQSCSTLVVTELDRKPSSCPYLYAWNGERFEFITDFMGGGEMGHWESPGVFNHPDPDEYVRIRDDQLRVRDGRYELRITNELEETLYVDRLQLVAVAHPADTDAYPNEGMLEPPRPFRVFTTLGARPPAAATDEHGHDVLDQVSRMDRRYPDDFGLSRIRGYADEHMLTLDLGTNRAKRTLLLLTAWTDYAFSSDNVAAQQAGMRLSSPALQVKDEQNRWKTVIPDIGLPVGRPQTIVLDLTGRFLSQSRAVRLVTNMRIYWDQILVDTSEPAPIQTTRLDPVNADLRWRGFSATVTPDGREPFGYDYDRVSRVSPWKVLPGRYTREGDVRELLMRTDDMFVVSLPGDEIALSFNASALPPLPPGWKTTFLLYVDGFSKEMDINSGSPDQVLPLPFHGMKRYPYSSPERYPLSRARRQYLERYNTRVIGGAMTRELAHAE